MLMSILRSLALVAAFLMTASAADTLRIATFQADVTPPLGTPLCCSGRVKPATTIVSPLTARGIILFGSSKPIVLVAVDWVGIAGEGWDEWRSALANAAGTDVDHVTVNTVHPHDAPMYDPEAERILEPIGQGGRIQNVPFVKVAIERTAKAVREAAAHSRPVTHLGLGKGIVEKVASNRRLIGPDGKVWFGRMSSCKNAEARNAPEGVIDPYLRAVSFWNGGKPVAVITFYATHPQSYYGQGGVNPDIPGIARSMRETALPGVAHIHFNGAGGNVAAGKYNNGSPEMRPILAQRLAAGMEAAWKSTVKTPIGPRDVGWRSVCVALPLAKALEDRAQLRNVIADPEKPEIERRYTARSLAWAEACKKGRQVPLFRLRLGSAAVLFMPGELFVEYQLEAQKMRPDSFVAMAAYGDSGPGYVGTRIAYSQGGYEAGPVSRTSPDVEDVLMRGMRELLK